MINSYETSKKEEEDLYDIFILANEENNKQIIDETLSKFKNLKEEVKKIEIKCGLILHLEETEKETLKS